MNKEEKVNLKILEDFKKDVEGKWPPELIDKTVKEVTSLKTQNYGAVADIRSVVFHQSIDVKITDLDRVFNGSTEWGISTPGIGGSAGIVFANDLNKLFSETKNFWFAGNTTYLGIYFYSDDGSLLGHFQGAALSFVIGTGNGTGQWN
ncbi:VapA/VapB family virulence-associated protein [Xenorhabdus sp. ZM]|uniref:VapA/VapB family virulence-associated protein n=1 Tax=Xenorhabdus szentirmaii TaxID=290112 RepID=UPI0019CD2852|nr:VapA/VapB family virulence-associated protein [Xenorhabdus sp. ZM]MBD2805209.1 VapA/VapB family virulence-associated protein [Xenorhabdus sp. ZM]